MEERKEDNAMDQKEFQFFKKHVFDFMNDNHEVIKKLTTKQFLTLSKDMVGIKEITVANLSYLLINQAVNQILAFRENTTVFADIEFDTIIDIMRKSFETSIIVEFEIIVPKRKVVALDVQAIRKEMEGGKRNG